MTEVLPGIHSLQWFSDPDTKGRITFFTIFPVRQALSKIIALFLQDIWPVCVKTKYSGH
jgi:hypothetical protein